MTTGPKGQITNPREVADSVDRVGGGDHRDRAINARISNSKVPPVSQPSRASKAGHRRSKEDREKAGRPVVAVGVVAVAAVLVSSPANRRVRRSPLESSRGNPRAVDTPVVSSRAEDRTSRLATRIDPDAPTGDLGVKTRRPNALN